MSGEPPAGVVEWCEQIEALAFADNVRAMADEPANQLGAGIGEVGHVRLPLLTSIPLPMFNRVVGLGMDRAATERDVDALVSFYLAAGQAAFAVSLSPSARPSELATWLEARGLVRSSNWAKLWRGADAPPDARSDLEIELIDGSKRDAFARINYTAWGIPAALAPWFGAAVARPGWRHYLGFDGDEPVSAAALYVADDVGWLGFGATLPSHRKRGGQGALVARLIRDAADLGCRLLVTETAEDTTEQHNSSYHNVIRAGFRLAYLRPNYIRRPPSWSRP
jgi:GNAT superfamily N-acetyltransferase